MGSEPRIAYQNKDIASKFFAEEFKSEYLDIYDLKLPRVVDILPTNLPEISANELRIDNLFLLEDGSILVIDYESKYNIMNKMKYLNYIIRVAKRFLKQGALVQIHMLIIYTADVSSEQTEAVYDNGAVRLELEEVFLSELDGDAIFNYISEKIRSGEKLNDREVMELVILPLTYQGKKRKKTSIRETFELVKDISDEDLQKFILSGILVFTDKIISRKDSDEIRRWIGMTKVGKIIEEEKRQAVEKVEQEKQSIEKERIEIATEYAKTLIEQGWNTDKILVKVRVLSAEEIDSLR